MRSAGSADSCQVVSVVSQVNSVRNQFWRSARDTDVRSGAHPIGTVKTQMMISSRGGERRSLLQTVKHIYKLGGVRAYYRGLSVSSRNDRRRGRGLIILNKDQVACGIPVFRDRHEHLRGIEASLRAVYKAGRSQCPGPARFRKHFWECWYDRCVPADLSSDEDTGFSISGPPTALYGYTMEGVLEYGTDEGRCRVV